MEEKESISNSKSDVGVEFFPTIKGKNLNKKSVTVPGDFLDKNLIVIVAFQRWHQNIVDESIEKLEEMKINHTHHIIEVPMMQQFSKLRRMRLDGIMRAAITDNDIRQRTITVYLDKEEFTTKLSIPNEDTIYWFVVEHVSKSILMRGSGIPSQKEIQQISPNRNSRDI